MGCSEEAARRSAFEGLRRLREVMAWTTRSSGPLRRRRGGPGWPARAERAARAAGGRAAARGGWWMWPTPRSTRPWGRSGPRHAAGPGVLAYDHEPDDDGWSGWRRAVSPRILEAPARLDRGAARAGRVLRRPPARFEIPIDWSLVTGLRARGAARHGRGSPTARPAPTARSPSRRAARAAARAAGNALGANPIPIVVPCHRVLRCGGAIGRLHRRGSTASASSSSWRAAGAPAAAGRNPDESREPLRAPSDIGDVGRDVAMVQRDAQLCGRSCRRGPALGGAWRAVQRPMRLWCEACRPTRRLERRDMWIVARIHLRPGGVWITRKNTARPPRMHRRAAPAAEESADIAAWRGLVRVQGAVRRELDAALRAAAGSRSGTTPCSGPCPARAGAACA